MVAFARRTFTGLGDALSDENEQQLEEITATLIAYAGLDFSNSPPVRGNGPLDAVVVGLIALGEELNASVVAKDLAEQANESKTQFLANMSHELRTPLMTILGSTDLLKMTNLTEQQVALTDRMLRAGDLLLRLISDVLDFSKIEAGALQFNSAPFLLSECMARAIDPHRAKALTKGLTIHDNRQVLPKESVLGDAHRIEQVMHNIVGNAVKYTERGDIGISFATRQVDGAPLLVIDVADTGVGISPERIKTVFDRFYVGDASNRRVQTGTGLGLSIARSLVQAMGGALTLKSTLGEGSRFTLTIPVPPAPIQPAVESPDCNEEPLRHHVLVVDDKEQLRDLVREMLLSVGCTVDVASSGQVALDLCITRRYDLILMDRQMPLLDGLETASTLLTKHPDDDLRIVAMTAHGTQQDREQSLAAGMLDHLNKPFTIGALRKAILAHAKEPKSAV